MMEAANVDIDVISQRLIKSSISVRYYKKWEYNGTARQPFIYFKKAYDLARREALYHIISKFPMPKRLVGLIKI
jgi:hypothetical protein